MTTIEERFAAIADELEAVGQDLSAKLRALSDANRTAQTDMADLQAAVVATTEQIADLDAVVKWLVVTSAPEPEPVGPLPEPVPVPVLLDVLQPDGCTIAVRPGTPAWSKIAIPPGQVVHRDGSAYVAPGSSVLADYGDDWYVHIRLDAIAATIIASRSVTTTDADRAKVEERAREWLHSDLRRTLDTGGSNGVAIYTHLAGLYFAAGKLGLNLASDDLTRHTTELTTLLKRADFRPNHNFRTGCLLLLASYLSASRSTADRDWETWADLWEDHLQTILKVEGSSVVDVHSATHGSGRGMHYTVMSLSGYLTGEAIMRTLDLPRTLPGSLLARAVETPWPDVIDWARKDTWSSTSVFRWLAANEANYSDNGAVNHDLVAYVSHQAAALGYNVFPSGSPKPTPYWTHTMPLAKS